MFFNNQISTNFISEEMQNTPLSVFYWEMLYDLEKPLYTLLNTWIHNKKNTYKVFANKLVHELITSFEIDIIPVSYEGESGRQFNRIASFIESKVDELGSKDACAKWLSLEVSRCFRDNPYSKAKKKIYGVYTNALNGPVYNLIKSVDDGTNTNEQVISFMSKILVENRILYSNKIFKTDVSQEKFDAVKEVQSFGFDIPTPVNGKSSEKLFTNECMRGVASFLGYLVETKRMVPFPKLVMHLVLPNMQSRISDPLRYLSSQTHVNSIRVIWSISNLETAEDIPENIDEMFTQWFDVYKHSNTQGIGRLLEKHSAVNKDLPAHPFIKKARDTKHSKGRVKLYSLAWIQQQPDDIVSPIWKQFFVRMQRDQMSTSSKFTLAVRCMFNWAIMKRGFATPNDITALDLLNIHSPNSKETLFHYIDDMKSKSPNTFWSTIKSCFERAYNSEILLPEYKCILTGTNPFSAFDEGPFKSTKNSVTVRSRIPNNIHEAMLQTLLSPDDEGNPTFSFVKDVMKYDWFDAYSEETGRVESVWCPSRAHALALLMILPVRVKQARWLDQGLLNDNIWNVEAQQTEQNTHDLSSWKYQNGNKHLEQYGCDSSVIQSQQDPFTGEEQLSIYVNTNKTQMWSPDAITGYPIHWPHNSDKKELLSGMSSNVSIRLDLPYKLIQDQMRFLNKYDPNPIPITFEDDGIDSRSLTLKYRSLYPYFTPIFRDLHYSQFRDDGTKINLAVSRSKIMTLFNSLAYHTEKRLRAQGHDATLTRKVANKKSTEAYKGYKTRWDLHSLRVFGVSYLMELGVSWPVVQMIVGHAAPAMTLHYNKPTPEFIRDVLRNSFKESDAVSGFYSFAQQHDTSVLKFVHLNKNASGGISQPNGLFDDMTLFVEKPGGICPVGGDMCDEGAVNNDKLAGHGKAGAYAPVSGGCGNCRFFCSTPAHLLSHQAVINEIFIKVRSIGKKQKLLAEKIKDLSWEESSRENQLEIQNQRDLLAELESHLEPAIREWSNRTILFQKTLEQLDEFIEFSKDKSSGRKGLILISSSTKEELLPELSFKLEQVGEFELVRQTLLASHLSGGIEKCEELTKLQIRDFMDRIMVHDNPSHLLLRIPDERTRDKVAFLMSEAMNAVVGTESIQKSLDNNTGLTSENTISASKKKSLDDWISGVFMNALKQGKSATIVTLLPSNLFLESTGE
ncbi:MAG: hypothetical protein JKX82_02640 [Oleispira sp.]|nr:hypothetical protein [Oleispira sp.]